MLMPTKVGYCQFTVHGSKALETSRQSDYPYLSKRQIASNSKSRKNDFFTLRQSNLSTNKQTASYRHPLQNRHVNTTHLRCTRSKGCVAASNTDHDAKGQAEESTHCLDQATRAKGIAPEWSSALSCDSAISNHPWSAEVLWDTAMHLAARMAMLPGQGHAAVISNEGIARNWLRGARSGRHHDSQFLSCIRAQSSQQSSGFFTSLSTSAHITQ